jgi:hypothetical protein
MSLFSKIFENIYQKKIWTDPNLKNPPHIQALVVIQEMRKYI